MASILFALVLFVLSYLLGSIPFAYIVAKVAKGLDIREHGSGNVGATNVLRVCGKGPGIVAYFLDFLKGLLPVLAVTSLTIPVETSPLPWIPIDVAYFSWLPIVTSIGIMLGHSKSVFLRFNGGKSAMSGLGTYIALNPLAGLVVGLFAVTIMKLTKTVSIGSMAAGLIGWLVFWALGSPLATIAYTALAGLYVVLRHKSNIQRLLSGTEHSFNGSAS